MLYRTGIPAVLLVAAVLCTPLGFATPAYAQGDLEAERASLRGISNFDIRITVEAPLNLSGSDALDSDALVEQVTGGLRAAGLPVVSRRDAEVFLHVHVNTMALENGLIPFAIEADFYQPVRLQRSGGTLSAATWSESVLGLVTVDRLEVIGESVDQLIDQFVRDFQAVRAS